MKTVGIIGGLSPESTISYYKGINEGIRQKLGANHNAKSLIQSVNFQEFCELKKAGDWNTQGKLLSEAAQNLEKGGADFIVLATNTMHKMADQIQASLSIPFLHIGDATAKAITQEGIKRTGLLGTKYTMELDFYKDHLTDNGLSVLIPNEAGRATVNTIIYDELCHGIIKEESKRQYLNQISTLQSKGAEGVILGCTEIGLLIKQSDIDLPIFDTTQIHIDTTIKYIFQ